MNFRRNLAVSAAVLVLAAAATTAHAQQTAPVDPGRIDERLRERRELPTVSPVEVPLLPQQEAAPESTLTVVLTDVRFEGAVSVPVEVLEALAARYIGHEIPLGAVFQLAEEVTAEYRRRGLVLSRAVVGPQRIEDGVVTIQILEGYIGGVTIEGEAGGYRSYLERYMAPVTASRPTDGAVLSRALLLARDLKGVDVRSVVTPSPALLAAADLSLVVERRPFEAYVAIDNRGSRWLGPVQIYGGAIFNDTLGLGERLSATVVAAPDDNELGFVALSYEQPLGGSGLRVNAFGSYARTRPGDELRDLGLEGESTTLGAGLDYPILRSRAMNVIGRSVFTARDSQSSNDLIDPVFDDKVRTLSAELLGNYADASGGFSSARVALTQGLNVFGATEDRDPDKSRATGSAQFTRFNIELSHVRPLSQGFMIQVAAAAQASTSSLLASEEFGLGGPSFGRAFDGSEVTGDEGVAGKVEVFRTFRGAGLASIEPYVFYEAGVVRQIDPLPGETRRESLGSAGIGVRVALNDTVGGSLEYAEPFERDIASRNDRDGRVFFSLSATF